MTRDQMIAKVAGLIKDIDIAMMTTEAEDGLLHSRPMATQKTEFDGTLTSTPSRRTSSIRRLVLPRAMRWKRTAIRWFGRRCRSWSPEHIGEIPLLTRGATGRRGEQHFR